MPQQKSTMRSATSKRPADVLDVVGQSNSHTCLGSPKLSTGIAAQAPVDQGSGMSSPALLPHTPFLSIKISPRGESESCKGHLCQRMGHESCKEGTRMSRCKVIDLLSASFGTYRVISMAYRTASNGANPSSISQIMYLNFDQFLISAGKSLAIYPLCMTYDPCSCLFFILRESSFANCHISIPHTSMCCYCDPYAHFRVPSSPFRSSFLRQPYPRYSPTTLHPQASAP